MSAFIDAHCHIDAYEEAAKETFDGLLARLTPETTPAAFIHSACDPRSFETAKRLSEKYPFVYAAYGIHPEYVLTETQEDEAAMLRYLKHPKAVACGEFGLDYHYDKEHAREQCALFERHLQLALGTRLPLTLHLREADDAALAILRSADIRGTKMHIHCFSGSAGGAPAPRNGRTLPRSSAFPRQACALRLHSPHRAETRGNPRGIPGRSI